MTLTIDGKTCQFLKVSFLIFIYIGIQVYVSNEVMNEVVMLVYQLYFTEMRYGAKFCVCRSRRAGICIKLKPFLPFDCFRSIGTFTRYGC